MKIEFEIRFKELRDTTDKLLDLRYTDLIDLIKEIDNIYHNLDRAISKVECEVENLEVKEWTKTTEIKYSPP